MRQLLQNRANPLEVLRSVDTDGIPDRIHNLDASSHLENSQLLEVLCLFQGSGGSFCDRHQDVTTIGIEAKMAQEPGSSTRLRIGNGSAREVKSGAHRIADDLHDMRTL